MYQFKNNNTRQSPDSRDMPRGLSCLYSQRISSSSPPKATKESTGWCFNIFTSARTVLLSKRLDCCRRTITQDLEALGLSVDVFSPERGRSSRSNDLNGLIL